MERLSPLPWQQACWTGLAHWRERMPHALLLYGQSGIGKRHLAGVIAQALLCEMPQSDGLACGACAGCALLASDNHPDFRLVVPGIDQVEREEGVEEDGVAEPAPTSATKRAKPSREIKIDQVRELANFLTTTTHRAGHRVVVLAPAESLNASAANALLKLLEEPAAATVFLLVADELDAVLPTIRSRCVFVRAPRPDRGLALTWLKERGIDDAELRLDEAGGAPLSAAASAEDDESGRQLPPPLREVLLGLLARGERLSLADVLAAVPKEVPIAASIGLFQRWGWDLLAERLGQRVRYYPSRQRALAAAGQAAEAESLLAWIDSLNQAQAASDHPLNGRLVVEGALLGYLDAIRARR